MNKKKAVTVIVVLLIVGVILTVILCLASKVNSVTGDKTAENCKYDYSWSIKEKKLNFVIEGTFEKGSWECKDTENILKLVEQKDSKNKSEFVFEYADFGTYDIRFTANEELEIITLKVYCNEDGTIDVINDSFFEVPLGPDGKPLDVTSGESSAMTEKSENPDAVDENGDYDAAVALVGEITLPEGAERTYAFAHEDEDETSAEFGFVYNGAEYGLTVYKGEETYESAKSETAETEGISEFTVKDVKGFTLVNGGTAEDSKTVYFAVWAEDGRTFMLSTQTGVGASLDIKSVIEKMVK